MYITHTPNTHTQYTIPCIAVVVLHNIKHT